MTKLGIWGFILPRQVCILVLLGIYAVYRSFNAIFGKVGRIASEGVVFELFKKCLPVLLYSTRLFLPCLW